ncbi:hypothetical protein ABW21_db0207222 [Orbilia brochopaga]|nr:hypothetical protein ABW21_db0207222 [Drechslerella brochopaga]
MDKQELQAQKREFVQTFLGSLTGTIQNNPHVLGAVAAAVPAGGAGFPALLKALGFSDTGPVAGSPAANWQSSIGDVPSGHLFSLIQGISMNSGGAIAIGAGIGLVAAVTIIITYLVINELVNNAELHAMIEQEIKKFGEAVAGFACHAGEQVGQFFGSQEVQDRVEDVRKAGEAAVQGAAWFFTGGFMGGW